MATITLERPRCLRGIREQLPAELIRDDGTIDWSPWYLTEEEDVGQSGRQFQIIQGLYLSMLELARERQWTSVLVGNDQFFAWVKPETLVQISPDVYLLDDPPPIDEELPGRWETWRGEHRPPRFAIEVVSENDWKKDYRIFQRYDHLGTDELVVIDAEAFSRDLSDKGRVPFQVYRRDDRGRLVAVYRGRGPAWSREIDAYLCFIRISKARVRVRISRDAYGRDVIAEPAERADAEARRADAASRRAQAESQRADAESQRADAESQRADALEAELAALRARLANSDGLT